MFAFILIMLVILDFQDVFKVRIIYFLKLPADCGF
jgi:hypothetical protein